VMDKEGESVGMNCARSASTIQASFISGHSSSLFLRSGRSLKLLCIHDESPSSPSIVEHCLASVTVEVSSAVHRAFGYVQHTRHALSVHITALSIHIVIIRNHAHPSPHPVINVDHYEDEWRAWTPRVNREDTYRQ
jgi:hypothetical protein